MIRVVTLIVSRISTRCVRWFEPVVSISATLRHRSLGCKHADSASPQAVVTGSTFASQQSSSIPSAAISVVTLVVSRISTRCVRWFEPVVRHIRHSHRSLGSYADSASPQAVVTGSICVHTVRQYRCSDPCVTLVVSRISTRCVRWFEPVVSTSASSVTEVWVVYTPILHLRKRSLPAQLRSTHSPSIPLQ